MLKPYYESEVQGPGRRFWFRRIRDAKVFADTRRERGYHAFVSGRTAWISFGKRRTFAIREIVDGGVDPFNY